MCEARKTVDQMLSVEDLSHLARDSGLKPPLLFTHPLGLLQREGTVPSQIPSEDGFVTVALPSPVESLFRSNLLQELPVGIRFLRPRQVRKYATTKLQEKFEELMPATHMVISIHCRQPIHIPGQNIRTLRYQPPHRRSMTVSRCMV